MPLPDHVVDHLIETAEGLLAAASSNNLGKVMRRRAISSAYYSLFHAICFIVTDSLIGWPSDAAIVDPVYRSVDHKAAKNRLRDSGDVALREIGLIFGRLQEKRNDADYAPPSHNPSAAETLEAIEQARQAVALIEQLTKQQRLAFAVSLIAKAR